MAKFFSLFKIIDDNIFKQLDSFKNSESYQKMTDQLSSLNENQQKRLIQALSIFIIILPILAILLLLKSNFSMRNDLKVKKDIIKTIQTYKQKTDSLASMANTLLSTVPLNNRFDLQKQVVDVLNASGIDQNKVKIENFQKSESTKSMSQIEADIIFSNLTISNLSKLFAGILQRKKGLITSLKIEKDLNNNLLNGNIHIIHYAKSTSK